MIELEGFTKYLLSSLFKSKRSTKDSKYFERRKRKNRRNGKLARKSRRHNIRTGHTAGRQ